MIKIKNFKNFFLVIFSLLLSLLFLELCLRIFINYKPNYYAAFKSNNKAINYPYGIVPVNSLGYFDIEFKKNQKKTIGYIGDSVLYGVGAGYPYRVTDILNENITKFNIFNLGTLPGQISFNKKTLEKMSYFQKEYNLERVVYLMNLNDISDFAYHNIPLNIKNNELKKNINFLKKINAHLSVINNSYLYNYTKFKIKSFLNRLGYDYHGYKAIELFPLQNKHYIEKISFEINKLALNSKKKNIKFCLAVLPYEMQISKEASEVYKNLGIKFSEAFVKFEPQKIILDNIDQSLIETIILGKSFDQNSKIGEYFVYNKGDKIDFNHLNRKGHLKISEEILKTNFCM